MHFSLLTVAIMLALKTVVLNAAPAPSGDLEYARSSPQNYGNTSPASHEGTQSSSLGGGAAAHGIQSTTQPIGVSGYSGSNVSPIDTQRTSGASGTTNWGVPSYGFVGNAPLPSLSRSQQASLIPSVPGQGLGVNTNTPLSVNGVDSLAGSGQGLGVTTPQIGANSGDSYSVTSPTQGNGPSQRVTSSGSAPTPVNGDLYSDTTTTQGSGPLQRATSTGNLSGSNLGYGPGYGATAGQAVPQVTVGRTMNDYSPYASTGVSPSTGAYYASRQMPQMSPMAQYPNGVSSTYTWRQSYPVYQTYTSPSSRLGGYAR